MLFIAWIVCNVACLWGFDKLDIDPSNAVEASWAAIIFWIIMQAVFLIVWLT